MADTRDDGRPDPDTLLERVEAEDRRAARGRLKVFFGASPGVGKTYAMLTAARRLKADGVDVVVGVVETHGREATAARAAGLEVLPRRAVAYRGATIEEMDLPGILRRRPAVCLIDELAHTRETATRVARVIFDDKLDLPASDTVSDL